MALFLMLLGLALTGPGGRSVWAEPATLIVHSSPPQAKVFVNGYYKGRAPVCANITTASEQGSGYEITVVLPGYDKWRQRVTLSAGRSHQLTAKLARRTGPIICLDPGHPSETSAGCKGPSGATENHINWVIALQLRDALQAQGYQVVLTKQSEDQKVTNRQRAQIANDAGAAAMIRLHCDAAPASGLGVYYPDRQGTRYGFTGPPRSIITSSAEFARAFYPAAVSALAGHLKGRGIHGDSATYVGARQGALTGSIFARVPVVTVEMCVLTNRRDEAFIVGRDGQALMTRAIAAGIQAALRDMQ